jgi:hypothetical protein
VLANDREAGRGLVVALDDDVLEQIAEARLDRALVATVHVEVVGDRALLANVAVRLHEHHARRITELRAAGGQFLERGEPRFGRGEFLLARADVAGPPFVLRAGRRQL